MKLQMVWGLGLETALVLKSMIQKLADSGVSIEWKGEPAEAAADWAR